MSKLQILAASTVVPTAVSWLVPGLIPTNRLAVLDGDPGQGKSYLTLDLASAITLGKTWGPKGHVKGFAPPANVLILNAEDDPDSTMVPRLRFMKANMAKIYFGEKLLEPPRSKTGPQLRSRGLYLPTDIAQLESVVKALEVRLLIIDPIMAFISPEISSNSDQAVRIALGCLKTLGQEMGVTVLLVRHLNKSGGNKVLYRGGGSIGIIGLTRSGMYVGVNPDDKDQKILAQSKNNLGPLTKPWAFRLRSNSNGDRSICWEGETQIPLSRVMDTAKEELPSEKAEKFLQSFLADATTGIPVTTIIEAATKAGITQGTLIKARKALQICTKKVGHQWFWQSANDAKQGVFDQIQDS